MLPGKLCGRRMPHVTEDLDFSDIHVGFDLSPSRNRKKALETNFPIASPRLVPPDIYFSASKALKRVYTYVISPLDVIV